MKIDVDKLLVREGEAVDLRTMRTLVKPFYKSHKQYMRMLEDHVTRLSALQQLHYASNRSCCLVDLSGDGRGWKRRNHQTRNVRGQSAGMSGIQLQTPEYRGTAA